MTAEHMSSRGESGETLMGLLVGLSVGLVVLAAGSALLANHLRVGPIMPAA